jgi:cell division septum initiation protein DivIVA
MDYKLILDVVVAVLLVVTIVYAWVLNQRLTQLRRNRDDLAKVVTSFNDATARAEAGIPKLRRAAEETGQSLQERMEKAQSLRDDLAFMIERADAMADRLEQSVRGAREEIRVPPPATAAPGPAHAPAPAPRPASLRMAPPAPLTSAVPSALDPELEDERSEAERELLRALQSVR